MRLIVLAAAGCLGLIAPAVAQESNDTTAAPATVEKKVCRNSVATGSIMKSRICHTKAEWKEIDRQNIQANDQFSARQRSRVGSLRD
jgi:hypothetical protein